MSGPPDEPPPTARGATLRRALPLATIVLVHGLVQFYVIAHTVVPARDAGRYMEFALRLEDEAWQAVARDSVDHPGYPLVLHATFSLGERLGLESPHERILLAQVANALTSLVLIIASYTLLKRFLGLLCAWFASLTFVVLPRVAWLFGDVLTEPVYGACALLFAAALLHGLESRRLSPFLLSGLFASLGYWVRVDALILPLIAVVTFVLMFSLGRAHHRWSPGRAVASLGCLAAVFSTSLALAFVLYGEISPKPSFHHLFGDVAPVDHQASATTTRVVAGIAGAGRGFWTAVGGFIAIAAQSLQFVHIGTAALAVGLACARRRLTTAGATLLAAAICYAALLVAGGAWLGYQHARYMLPLLPFVVGFGMYGASELGGFLDARRGRRHGFAWRRACVVLVLVASLTVSLPSLLGRSLHDNRLGTLEAGRWIAAHAEPSATVHDPYFFPTYLAGLGERRTPQAIPASRAAAHYLVLEDRHLRTPGYSRVRRLIKTGRVVEVAGFPRTPREKKVEVRVYRRAPRRRP